MADENIAIDILVNGKPAIDTINTVANRTTALAAATSKSGDKMTASWLKIGAAIAIVTVAASKALAASEAQVRAEISLTTALRINGKQGEKNAEMWGDYATQLQNMTAVGDEAILQQVTYLKTLKLSDKQTEDIIATSLDLSVAMGMSLESAVMNLSKTFSGLQGELGEKIPALKALTAEQLKAGDAIGIVKAAVEGQAKALGDTDLGEWSKTVAKAGDAWESLGDVLLAFISDSGILAAVQYGLQGIDMLLTRSTAYIKFLGDAYHGTKESRIEYLKVAIETLKKDEELYGSNNQQRIKEYREELEALTATVKKGLEVTVTKGEDAMTMWDKFLARVDLVQEGMKRFVSSSKDEFGELLDVGKKAGKGIEDFFVNMAMGVKTSFADLAKSILADLIRIQVRKNIVAPLSEVLFHTGGEVKHTGGAIGRSSVPSFHTGYRSDERLAKLQVGESVINRHGTARNKQAIDAMNAGMSIGGGGQVINVTYSPQVNALDPSTAASVIAQNAPTVVGVVRQAFNRNGQSVKL